MTAFESLPDGWQVWNEDADGSAILVYRPDVFDSQQYPAPCLPTIRVAQRPPSQGKPRANVTHHDWYVSLRLEPEVRVKAADERFDAREDAVDGAVDLAARFQNGEIDYRDAYQVPRDDYLDALDELTGREA